MGQFHGKMNASKNTAKCMLEAEPKEVGMQVAYSAHLPLAASWCRMEEAPPLEPLLGRTR
jgi:hypothetical protein